MQLIQFFRHPNMLCLCDWCGSICRQGLGGGRWGGGVTHLGHSQIPWSPKSSGMFQQRSRHSRSSYWDSHQRNLQESNQELFWIMRFGKTIFLPLIFFGLIIVPLLMTVIRTGLQSCQHFCLTAKHFSVLLRFHKNGGIYWRANRFRSSGLRPENVSEFANQFDGDKWRASFDKPNLTLLRLLPWVMFSCFLPWMDFHFALRFWQKQKVGQEN